MDQKTYLKELRKLNAAYIKVNRRLQDGEIITQYAPPKKFVVLRATGVNTYSNCEISYMIQEIEKDGTLGLKCPLYGYEWEKYKPTGQYYEFTDDDDILS